MNSKVSVLAATNITYADIEGWRMWHSGTSGYPVNLSTQEGSRDIIKAADEIILLAEKIKVQRLAAGMQRSK